MRAYLFGLALFCTGIAAHAADSEPAWTWAASTASPAGIPPAALSDREADLLSHCGTGEDGLRVVAMRLVARKLHDLPYLDLDGLTFAQRTAGEPHVWPRAWVVSGRALDHATTLKKMDTWRASFRDLGERRCGIATGFAADGTEVVAAIALDALADMSPLPLRARTGAWLTLEARVLVPATGARVIVLGPGGEPRNVPTSFEAGRVRAKFALDRPGMFLLQVVAEVATGPRPVLEAQLFADVEPAMTAPSLAVPGESAGDGATEGVTALTRMVLALRADEHLSPMARDARLDALALAHARRMQRSHTVGHDVGDGDPRERLQKAGLSARQAGENVAHAPSIQLAHRALFASPSHRANLLRVDFTELGVAVLDDPDGSVWVAEVFAAGLR